MPEDLVLYPGAASAIRTLNEFGFYVGVCTNQSGISRGYLTEADNGNILTQMHGLLAKEGACVNFVTWCSHSHDDIQCDCRKPRPGQWHQHVKLGGHAVLEASKEMFYMVGDMVSDLQFAKAIGARPVFVACGLSSVSDALHAVGACPVALDLNWAVEYILDSNGLEVC